MHLLRLHRTPKQQPKSNFSPITYWEIGRSKSWTLEIVEASEAVSVEATTPIGEPEAIVSDGVGRRNCVLTLYSARAGDRATDSRGSNITHSDNCGFIDYSKQRLQLRVQHMVDDALEVVSNILMFKMRLDEDS